MCYGVSGQVLFGFPSGNPAVTRLGYGVLERYRAQLLSQVVTTLRPGHGKLALPTEVGLIQVPPGAEQATIAELQKLLVYRGLELWDHEQDLRRDLLVAFHPDSPPPFTIEPNAAMAVAQAPAAVADFVHDQAHRKVASTMLGFANVNGRGAGVRVGILDSGVNHLARPRSVVEELNVIDWDDPQRRNDAVDGYGHGSRMARIIADRVPDADFLIARIADDSGCTTTWHLMAGLAVVSDCQVVNVSVASSPQATRFTCGQLSDELVSGNLASVVRDVSQRDAVIVAAAGNRALAHLAYPARIGQALAIVSVNSSGRLSSFSNHGDKDHEGSPHAAVFASPGGDAQDQSGAVTELVGTDAPAGTAEYFGTSYATAYATAAVALHREANPANTREQTIAALIADADDTFQDFDPTVHGNGLLTLT